jgi:photosystem II stability/assembly factor-like uncharacterized protein
MITRSIAAGALVVVASLGPALTARVGSDEWTTSGPAGGIINAVAVDPQIPTTVYAGTDQGGVFKSTDGGGSWFAVNSGLPGGRVFELAIDPQISSTLYAIVLGSGIFKSLDGGGTWSAAQGGIPPSTARSILALAIDPQTPTTLYVGTNGDNVFKTTNGGTSWSRSGPSNTQAFAIDPQTPTTLYAGTDLQLFKSTDGGASWGPLQTGLRATWVSALAIDPVAPGTIYLATRSYETSPPYHWLRKSTDSGASWSDSTEGLSDGMLRAVAVDHQNPSTLYAGGSQGVFKSGDAGASWSVMNEGLTDLAVGSLALDPEAATLYAGTNSGVFARTFSPPRFTLTVGRSGIGRGTVTSSPVGIDCGSDCAEPYAMSTTVTLTAAPAFGSIFTGWSGCDAVSGTRCMVVMNAERSVGASFLGLPLAPFSELPRVTRLGASSRMNSR